MGEKMGEKMGEERCEGERGDGSSLLICWCGCECTVVTDSGLLAWGGDTFRAPR
jgi:hypothetical protein